MFDRFMDHLDRGLGKKNVRWRRIVDAFRLKYPEVNIDPIYLEAPDFDIYTTDVMNSKSIEPVPPGGYLVWRVGERGFLTLGSYTPLPAGTYVVQLCPSMQRALRVKDRFMTGPDRVPFASCLPETGGNTAIIGHGRFDYDAPVGELTSYRSFLSHVFPEDRRRFVSSRR